MGLDYPSGSGEAITLAVLPGEGPSLQLKDTSTLVRAGLILDKHSAATFYGISPKDKSLFDVSVMKLAPYVLRQVVLQPTDNSFKTRLRVRNHRFWRA
jgi:hypothetical protein